MNLNFAAAGSGTGTENAAKKENLHADRDSAQRKGKAVLRKGVTVTQAARKLNKYEATGLTPQEVFNLIERAHNLEKRVKTLEDWL